MLVYQMYACVWGCLRQCVRVFVCLVSAFFLGGGGCWKIHIFIIYRTYSMDIFRCYMYIFNWWICSFYVGSKPTIYPRFPKSHTLFPCKPFHCIVVAADFVCWHPSFCFVFEWARLLHCCTKPSNEDGCLGLRN